MCQFQGDWRKFISFLSKCQRELTILLLFWSWKRWTKRDIDDTTIQLSLFPSYWNCVVQTTCTPNECEREEWTHIVFDCSAHFNHFLNMLKKFVNDHKFWQFGRYECQISNLVWSITEISNDWYSSSELVITELTSRLAAKWYRCWNI